MYVYIYIYIYVYIYIYIYTYTSLTDGIGPPLTPTPEIQQTGISMIEIIHIIVS